MKYSKTRKLNLSMYGGPSYETVDLVVEGCESPEQADEQIAAWAKNETAKYKKSTPYEEPDIEVDKESLPF